MKTQYDYTIPEIEACLIVMRELFTYLKPYRNHIALIGGWVPYFLLEKYSNEKEMKHVGSLDVDFVLDIANIPGTAYKTILEILQERGFYHKRDRLNKEVPASFLKKVTLESGDEIEVQVDFLAPEYGGSPKNKRHQTIQDVLARKGRGTDIVFKSSEVIHLSGAMLNRAHVECDIKIANIAACFIMKGIAMGERTSEKDAYDLYMLTRYYKEGPKSVLEELSLLKHKGFIREAMRNIEESFKKIDSIGPVSVVEFIGETDNEERIRLQRDVYEVMQFIIEGMKTLQ